MSELWNEGELEMMEEKERYLIFLNNYLGNAVQSLNIVIKRTVTMDTGVLGKEDTLTILKALYTCIMSLGTINDYINDYVDKKERGTEE